MFFYPRWVDHKRRGATDGVLWNERNRIPKCEIIPPDEVLFSHFPRTGGEGRRRNVPDATKVLSKVWQGQTFGWNWNELSTLVIHRRLLFTARRQTVRDETVDGFTQTRVTNNRSVPLDVRCLSRSRYQPTFHWIGQLQTSRIRQIQLTQSETASKESASTSPISLNYQCRPADV